MADQSDGLHAGVGERRVAGELGQTLHGVLEGVDGGRKVLLKYIRCEKVEAVSTRTSTRPHANPTPTFTYTRLQKTRE